MVAGHGSLVVEYYRTMRTVPLSVHHNVAVPSRNVTPLDSVEGKGLYGVVCGGNKRTWNVGPCCVTQMQASVAVCQMLPERFYNRCW